LAPRDLQALLALLNKVKAHNAGIGVAALRFMDSMGTICNTIFTSSLPQPIAK
jgi:hypothetical protein